MVNSNRCPRCGAERGGGLCPKCLLRLGLDGRDARSRGARTTVASFPTYSGTGGVLDSLASTIGAVPRVLLRDTAPWETPSPQVKPTSTEQPDGAGRLLLFGEIARGGMGAVLKGRDPDLGRELAVKVLLDSHRDHPDLVRRFVEEAQIAGQLQHPGVVPVYELGQFPDARPYFVMKLVKGRTLATALADRDDPAEGRMDFVRILLQVGQTVAYAHTRGVIHRDLKPSNVMLGSFGEVQVMDWGLAKLLGRTETFDGPPSTRGSAPGASLIATRRSDDDLERTRPGLVMGTPAYMAPEQARGEVDRLDERADVFALGSMLCEVITGRPSVAGTDIGEIQRKAAAGEFGEVWTRLDSSGADHELIALAKLCLAPLREDRLRDASAFVETLGDFLASIEQRLRAAELERAAETARAEEAVHSATAERRARRLTGALAAAVLGLVALGVGGWSWLETNRQARRAKIETAVGAAVGRADRLAGEARSTPGVSSKWDEALAQAQHAHELLNDDDGPDGPLRARVEQTIIDLTSEREAAKVYHRLLDDLEAARGVRSGGEDADRAAVDYAHAFIRAGFDLVESNVDSEKAAAWLRRWPNTVELASYIDDWAYVWRRANLPEAPRLQLVAIARAADPDVWRDRVREAIASGDPGKIEALRGLADDAETFAGQPAASLLLLARLMHDQLEDHARCKVLMQQAWNLHPTDFWINYDFAWEYFFSRTTNGPIGDMKAYATAAVAIRPDSGIAHYALGIAFDAEGDRESAIAQFREALRVKPDLNFFWAPRALFDALQAQGKQDQAIDEFRESARRRPGLAWVHLNLAFVLIKVGRFDEAVASYRKAVAVASADRSPAVLRLRPLLVKMIREFDAHAHALDRIQQTEGATAAFRGAVEIARRVMDLGAGSYGDLDLLGSALAALGEHLQSHELWSESEPPLRECLALRRRHPADTWPRYYTASSLGEALTRLGRFDEAEPLVLEGYQGVDARKVGLGPGQDSYLHDAARRVVGLYEAWNKPDEAAAWRAKLYAGGALKAPVPSRELGD